MQQVIRFDEVARREETVRLGLWMFLATVAMLFAAFASAYIVRRSGSDWVPINLPSILWLNTLVLVASSAALEAGHRSGVRGQRTGSRVALAASLLLGVGFLAGQVGAWRELMDAKVFMPSSPHSAFFYMLTGAHGLHVVAALGVLAWATAQTWLGLGERDRRRWSALMGSTRTFWHFLLGVWAFVFLLLASN